MAGLVIVWVIALIGLLVGAVSSSGPAIATSLIALAATPFILLLVLSYSSAKRLGLRNS